MKLLTLKGVVSEMHERSCFPKPLYSQCVNIHLINNILCFKSDFLDIRTQNFKFRLTSRNHIHCILELFFHVTHSRCYLSNLEISGILFKYVSFLSSTFCTNISLMNKVSSAPRRNKSFFFYLSLLHFLPSS